jgi:hypothetical protein
LLLTLLLARIPPKLLPLAPNSAEATELAALLTVAFIWASERRQRQVARHVKAN